MGLFRSLITEALDRDSASDTIASYFGRKLGKTYHGVNVITYPEFRGKLYLADDLSAIRINWHLSEFEGISVWKNYSKNIDKPDFDLKAVEFGDSYDSLARLLPKLLDALEGGLIEAESVVKKVPGEYAKPIVDKAVLAMERNLGRREEYSDINTVYEDIEVQAKSVAKGLNPALLICGQQGGTGKSYTVKKAMREAGLWYDVDYIIVKGSVTANALYKELFEYYDRVIIFDDCDSVLIGGSDSTNMLKAALDSGERRIVSWENADAFKTRGMSHEEIRELWSKPENKNKHPSSFEFAGGVIFISNLSKDFLRKKDAALLTRCLYVNVNIRPTDMIERMRQVLPSVKIFAARKIDGDAEDVTNPELVKKVFDFLSSPEFTDDPRNAGKSISFRILNQIYLLAYSGAREDVWKRLAFSYMS